MPPHQPVPITATSTCCTLMSPVSRYRIPVNTPSAKPIFGAVQRRTIPHAPRQPDGTRRPAPVIAGPRPAVRRRGAIAAGSIRTHAALLDHLGPLGGFGVHIG